jgi:ABC-type transport system involved in multi-copper enzyme maturation permease subunit
MMGSVRAELLRFRRWPAAWIIVGAWLLLNLMFGYLFNYLSYSGEGGSGFADEEAPTALLMAEMLPDNAPLVLVQGMPMFGGALMMILGGLAVGSGYGWRTWKTVFTAGPKRHTALGGTYVALGFVVVALVAITFVFDLAAALTIASVESQEWTWPTLQDTAAGLGSGLLITAMWTAGGVFLGTMARGPSLAIGLGLVWALVVENLLRGVAGLLGPIEALTNVLPGTAAGSLVGALSDTAPSGAGEGTPGVLTILDGGAATVTLGAYLFVFLVATTLVTMRRDLT